MENFIFCAVSYKHALKYGWKTFIIDTSTVKRIRMTEFNQHIENWNCELFQEGQLNSYSTTSLTHSLVESLRKFLSVTDLRVDGRNTYQQTQCSPQNNSNSQPEYARLYLPVSTTLAPLPAIRSSICLDPTLWPAWLGKTCRSRSWSFHQYSS